MSPPPAPPAKMPPLPAGALDARDRRARVAFDTDVPARVEWVGHSPTLLCAHTPCAVSLPYGAHKILFVGIGQEEARTSTVVVRVSHAAEIVNHTLGLRQRGHGRNLGPAFAWLGAVILATGAVAKRGQVQAKDFGSGPAITAFVYIASAPLIAWIWADRYHDGATTQWSPPPALRRRQARRR
jgi:hypothetical protein